MTPPEELKSQSAAIAVEGIVDPGQGRPGGGAEAAHPVGAGAAHLVASDSTGLISTEIVFAYSRHFLKRTRN